METSFEVQTTDLIQISIQYPHITHQNSLFFKSANTVELTYYKFLDFIPTFDVKELFLFGANGTLLISCGCQLSPGCSNKAATIHIFILTKYTRYIRFLKDTCNFSYI